MSNDKANATYHPDEPPENLLTVHDIRKHVTPLPATQSMDENDPTAVPPAHMDEH
jgi:hypothetical protein